MVGVCGRSRNDHLAAAEFGHVIPRPGRSVGVVVRSAPKGLDRRAVPVLPVVEDAGIETRIAVFIRILPVVGTFRIVDRLSGHRSVGIDHLLRRTGQTLAVGDADREILDFDAVADFRRAGQDQLFVARDHREKLPVVGRSAGDHLLVPVRLRDGVGFVDVVIAQSDHFGRGGGLPAFLVVGAVTDEFVVAAVVALAVIERAGGIKQQAGLEGECGAFRSAAEIDVVRRRQVRIRFVAQPCDVIHAGGERRAGHVQVVRKLVRPVDERYAAVTLDQLEIEKRLQEFQLRLKLKLQIVVGFGQFFESDDADIGVADEFVVILPAAVGIAFPGRERAVGQKDDRRARHGYHGFVRGRGEHGPVYAVVAVLVGFVERESQIDAEYVSFGLLVVREYKVGIIFVERHIFEVAGDSRRTEEKKRDVFENVFHGSAGLK